MQALMEVFGKRYKWAGNCRSGLRRIRFLRATLARSTTDQHLTEAIERSGRVWRDCNSDYGYIRNIGNVRRWRQDNKPHGPNPRPFKEPDLLLEQVPYDAGKDVNVPIIDFRDWQPADVDAYSGTYMGSISGPKNTINDLLDKGDKDQNLLFKSRPTYVGRQDKTQ